MIANIGRVRKIGSVETISDVTFSSLPVIVNVPDTSSIGLNVIFCFLHQYVGNMFLWNIVLFLNPSKAVLFF